MSLKWRILRTKEGKERNSHASVLGMVTAWLREVDMSRDSGL